MFRFLAPRYGFDVDRVTPDLLFAHYETEDHFDWHSDLLNEGDLERKLSASILLDRSVDLIGGDLEFHHSRAGEGFSVGSAVVFPSHLAHRVTPVVSGHRDVLVAWFVGPRLR